jgi:beta-glucosidase
MTLPYQEPGRSIEERASDLLARMTLEEKTAQMHALWLILSEDGEHRPRQDDFTGGTDPAAVKKALGHGLGQVSRALGSHGVEPRTGVRALNRLQKFLREETRLGIPAMSHEECLVGLMARGATMFPSALAYGATWNPDLVERVAQAIGREARSVGCHQGLAPVFDVSRDVRWGRTEETFGEDPYLVGVLGTRFVRGLQGEKRDLLATLKHYAGHSWSEGARNHAPVHLGWRELNDVFLLPFEMAVKQAHAGSVMPAYHDVDNESCHASRHLLTDVLRGEWGFDGLIVADYIGISLLYQHHNLAADRAEAAAIAFNAGLDIELPADDCTAHLGEAVRRGLLSMETIDAIVKRILVEKLRLGIFERPYVDEGAIELQSPATVGLAREVARQAVVVLENRGVLPLDPGRGQRIALIGPTADDPLAPLCGYSFPVHLILNDAGESAAQVVTPRAAFEKAFGADRVAYAQGCLIIEERKYGSPVFPGDVERSTTLDQVSPVSRRTDLIPAAVACAQAADVAVVCVGDLAGLFQTGTIGEGSDADSLDLPGVQQQLLEAVVATGKPVVVVLTSGRPYNLGGLEERVAAFVMAFAGGQEGGALGPALRLRAEERRRRSLLLQPQDEERRHADRGALRQPLPVRPRPRLHVVRARRPRARRSGGGRRHRRDPPAVHRAQHGVARRGGGAAALREGPPRLRGAAGQGAQSLRPGRARGGRVGAGHLRGADRHALLHGCRRPAHRRAGRARASGGRLQRGHAPAHRRPVDRESPHPRPRVAHGEPLPGGSLT